MSWHPLHLGTLNPAPNPPSPLQILMVSGLLLKLEHQGSQTQHSGLGWVGEARLRTWASGHRPWCSGGSSHTELTRGPPCNGPRQPQARVQILGTSVLSTPYLAPLDPSTYLSFL